MSGAVRAFLAVLALVLSTSVAGQSATLVPAPPQRPSTPAVFASAADFSAAGAVHAVLVYEAAPPSTSRPLVEVSPGQPPIGMVRVNVKAAGPITLVLGAYRPVYWDIRLAPGARLAKVIAQGNYRPYLSSLPPETKVVVYHADPKTGVDALFAGDKWREYALWDSVERLTGAVPATVQATYSGSEFDIHAGTVSLRRPTLASLVQDSNAVGMAVVAGPGGRSSDGLEASNCCNQRTYATFLANRAYRTGRYYAEAQIVLAAPPGEAGRVGAETNIGVMSVAASPGRLLGQGSHVAGIGFPVLDAQSRGRLGNGDVVGIAIDLVAHRVHHRVNGQWVAGAPGSGKGIALRPGLDYLLAAALTAAPSPERAERWRFNLGQEPFRTPPPDGFAAYRDGPPERYVHPLFADIIKIARATSGTPDVPDRAPRQAAPGASTGTPCSDGWPYEVHAVGVYEGPRPEQSPDRVGVARVTGSWTGFSAPSGVEIASRPSQTPHRPVRLDVRTASHICLFLTAYEPVLWQISRANSEQRVRVVAGGYYAPIVSGAGLSSSDITWLSGAEAARAVGFYGQPQRRAAFAAAAQQATGSAPASVQAAYAAHSFVIGGPPSPPSPSPTATKPRVERTVMCGRTTIVCDDDDVIICGGQRIPCR